MHINPASDTALRRAGFPGADFLFTARGQGTLAIERLACKEQ
jgi:hypothetical protein